MILTLRKIMFLFVLLFLTKGVYAQIKPEVYATVPYPVGNIAYDYKQELVFSNHPFFNPEVRVMHYNPKTKKVSAFPNKSWNSRSLDNDHYLDDVLGIRNDSKGVVWMLDMGLKSGITPKLVGWNTKKNRLERIYYIPRPASRPSSQLNDFVIDESRNIVVIADEDIGNGGNGNNGALVILDMKTGVCRRVLEGHYSTIPEQTPIVVDGTQLNIPGTNKPILVGADGITLDKKNEWLYYAPLNGRTVYRVRMEDLLENKDSVLSLKVEKYATKDNNGGFSIDKDGNLYTTYIEKNAIGVIPVSTKKSFDYAIDSEMIWPDGVSYNKDGYMYVSAAQLTRAAVFNNGKDLTKSPFLIFRFKPLQKGIWGR
ncbi:MAG: major royal jelly family protein [Prolixibacteraceae bacterium]|nr:major royal jelly family protein [Prolixibacteraceae bacterium]